MKSAAVPLVLLACSGSAAVAIAIHVSRPDTFGIPSSVAVADAAFAPTDVCAIAHARPHNQLGTNAGGSPTPQTPAQNSRELLPPENVPTIVRSLSPEELHTPFGAEALKRWLSIDAAAASRWLAGRSDATEHHAWLVARRLGENRSELLAYCDALPASPWREKVLHQASLENAGTRPGAAIELAQRMVSSDERTNALETVAYAWFIEDATAALHWAGKIEDTALRERLLAVGARAIVVNDPDLAARWLVHAAIDERTRRETALRLVETWAACDPPKAARWVAEFPFQQSREHALEVVARGWLQSDPSGGVAWLQTLPERPRILARLEPDHGNSPSSPDPPDI